MTDPGSSDRTNRLPAQRAAGAAGRKIKVLLVAPDGPQTRDDLRLLEEDGFMARAAEAGPGLFEQILLTEPQLLIISVDRPGFAWRGVFNDVRSSHLSIETIVLVTPETQGEGMEAVQEEAAECLVRPISPQAFLFRIHKALEGRDLKQELKELKTEVRFRRNQDYLVGVSPKIQAVHGKIQKVAGTDLKILITGERGTGKELVARTIHYNSNREGGPFIAVQCGNASPRDLEGQLFGYAGKGDADPARRGALEEAEGGTLFLDEISGLSPALQIKLLNLVERGRSRNTGDLSASPPNVRILASTVKDLAGEVEEGRFREDLYLQLNNFSIHLPPLRERKEDIGPLASHFVMLHRKEISPVVEGFSASAIQKLMFHAWPGNVGELEMRVREAMRQASRPLIYREDILLEDRIGSTKIKSFKEAKQEFEKNYLINVLRIAHGNVTEAARLAQKDRKDFYEVMRKHGLKSEYYRKGG